MGALTISGLKFEKSSITGGLTLFDVKGAVTGLTKVDTVYVKSSTL